MNTGYQEFSDYCNHIFEQVVLNICDQKFLLDLIHKICSFLVTTSPENNLLVVQQSIHSILMNCLMTNTNISAPLLGSKVVFVEGDLKIRERHDLDINQT